MIMEFVYEIENAAPKNLCEDIIECFLKDDKKKPSTIQNSVIDSNIRKSTNLWITYDDDIWRDKIEKLFKIFLDGLVQYSEHLYNSKLITNDMKKFLFGERISMENFFVNRSEEGEYYHWHTDHAPNVCRYFSCLLYLNTLEKDKGGCTEFMCGKKIRPEQGKLLIFPSTWTHEHRGAEVKNGGVKYICGNWMSN